LSGLLLKFAMMPAMLAGKASSEPLEMVDETRSL